MWSSTFILLLLMNLLNGIAGMMTIPLVAKYALFIEDNLTLASTIAGLMSMVSLVICPFAGAVTDRFNRKQLLIVSNLGYGACLVLHACCSTIPALIAMRLFTGLFFSVCSVTNVAFCTSFIPKERTGEGLGYVALASVLAQALGPSIGLRLLKIGGYSGAFACAGIFALGCMAVVCAMPYRGETKPAGKKRKIRFGDLYAGEFTCFLLMTALFSSCNGLVNTYLAIVAEERAIANIGIFFTVYSAFMVILRPLIGKLLDKRGIYFILIPSFVFAAAGMLLIGIGSSLAMLLAASACKALGQGSGTPSMQAHCVKSMDKRRAGVAASTVMIGQNVGNAAAPIIGSFFVGSVGYEGMFCGFGGIMLAAGMILIWIQYCMDRRRENKIRLEE